MKSSTEFLSPRWVARRVMRGGARRGPAGTGGVPQPVTRAMAMIEVRMGNPATEGDGVPILRNLSRTALYNGPNPGGPMQIIDLGPEHSRTP